jgi:ankyrin repeat protein
VEVDNPEVAVVLLAAGASPDLGQPISEAVGHGDQRCLQLLLAHGASLAGTWAVGAAVYHDDAFALSLLLDALQGSEAARMATEALPEAAAHASLPVVAALLGAGADPSADEDGVSALRLAVRAGRTDAAARLRAVGATDDVTDIDHFIGACISGDRSAAEGILAGYPDLPGRLTDRDRAVIVDAAGSRPASTIALMLDLGFSPLARNQLGEQPLHTAAYNGNAAVTQLLLGAGADVDARDARFDGTPLAFATVGSGEQAGQPGDWTETVRLLIEAGASRHDVWVAGKPPSEQIAAMLQRYGITPDEPADHQPDDQAAVPGSVGTGVMADIARRLETAFRGKDVSLLGTLLHPQVHWTGLCTSSDQVLDWYRALGGRAEGARPAPRQQLYQVFTVEDSQIIDIRGYPDRHSALTRDQPGPPQ